MDGPALILTWVAFGMGVLSLAFGVISLTRRRVAFPWLRQRTTWQQYGWSQVLFSVYLLLETGPRLSNVSPDALVTISTIAFLPLVAAIVVMMRAQRPNS
jgi:tellurite resistance protein TehA-like permease